MPRARFYIALFFLFVSVSGISQHVYVELMPGNAIVLPSRLQIHQDGYPDLDFTAKYRVQGFEIPIYYSYRLGFVLSENWSLEAEMNHLKIYLKDSPPEIQKFWISHGYNQVFLSLLREYGYFDLRFGVGIVIAHPENIVRGMVLEQDGGLFDNGYHLNGACVQGAIHKRHFFGKHFYVEAEAKATIAYAKTEVVNGYAKVPVYALHLLGGVGFAF